ncbi:MAG: ester cyclase [Actinomycetota bacterium]
MADDAANFRRVPLEIFNEGRTELIDELFADDYAEHISLPPGVPATREGVHLFTTALRSAFPDVRYDVVGQFQDGDMHIGHVRVTATMTGDFLGMPASGRSATWEEIHIARMSGGQIREHWGVVDQLGMLQQLGFVPPPPGT